MGVVINVKISASTGNPKSLSINVTDLSLKMFISLCSRIYRLNSQHLLELCGNVNCGGDQH
jgi:hypothetical protein